MKLHVLQENLRAALIHVSKAIPSKPQLSILSSILLTANENGLELAATDLYFGVKTKMAGEVEESGSLVVPGKTLLESINSLGAGKITLEVTKTSLSITSGKNHLEINGQASDEYPAFPTPSGQEYLMPLAQLEQLDQYVRFSAGNDPTRLILTALLFIFENNSLKVVGTDGFRLAHLVTPVNAEGIADKFLIPARAITEVCRIMVQEKAQQVSFFLSHDLKQVSFTINQTDVFVRLVEGDYPPFEKIMPASFAIQASWDGEEFVAQLKRAVIFARETSNIIRFQLEKDTLTLSATSALQGSFKGEMPLTMHEGTQGSIAFNARYLMDFVTTVKPQQIWFGMNESLKPALFRPVGMNDYTYIVMPFRVNE